MACWLVLAGALTLALQTSHCRAAAFYQSHLEDYLHIAPGEPAVNPWYPRLTYFSVKASWQDLQSHFPLDRLAQDDGESTCLDIARTVVEPYHPSMLIRNRRVQPWRSNPGPQAGVPKALCHLGPESARPSYADFLAVKTRVTAKEATMLRHYKVIGGRLYVEGHAPWYLEPYEEMVLLAVYLYQLPDMDFYLSWGDEPIADAPVLQWAMNLTAQSSGCSYPYKEAWSEALTLQQSMQWAACIRDRYRPDTKQRRAIWRGSTTDPHTQHIALSNALHVARIQLHILGLIHPDVLDTKVAAVKQSRGFIHATPLTALLGSGGHANHVAFEDFQRSQVVLDMDGNSFSQRLHQLVQMGGPVLKQASPLPSYFEHLFAPGVVPIRLFANNLSDVAEQARSFLQELEQEPRPNQWDDATANMHAVAAITLNRWSMIESVAYSLNQLAQQNTWVAALEPGFSQIPWSKCCYGGSGLPDEFVTAMQNAED